MILPKQIFFYWGKGKLSYLRYLTIYSFSKWNPDFKIVLIKRNKENNKSTTVEKLDTETYFGNDYFNELKKIKNLEIRNIEDYYPEIVDIDVNEIQRSDILSWYILGNEGGIVSDMDILYSKPFPYNALKNTDIGLIQFNGNPKNNYVPVSFMIGTPNQFFKNCYIYAINHINKRIYETAGTPVILKNYSSINGIQESFPDLTVTKLPSKIVFPFSEEGYTWIDYFRLMYKENVSLSDESIGIHWYAAAPLSKEINNLLTHETYTSYTNTIGKIVNEVLR